MKYLLYIAVLVLSVGFALPVNARDINETVSFSEFRGNPEVFEGRMVEVSARVIAISADARSMELFESESKTIIKVTLGQMSEKERKGLINGDVRQVSVVGRAVMTNGRVTIDAEKVVRNEVVPTAVVSMVAN
jgi:hypothetical protein